MIKPDPQPSSSTRGVLLPLGAICVVCIVLALLAWALFQPPKDSLGYDAIKSLLQVGVVTVAGAVISLVASNYQKDRERNEKERERQASRQEYREELLMRVLDRASSKYSAVKKARRFLRARGQTGDAGHEEIKAAEYYAQLDSINDAQLELENLSRDVETSQKAFTEASRIIQSLKEMDAYLHTLLDELKGAFRLFADRPTASLSNFPALKLFITFGDTPFKTRFVDAFRSVQRLLREDLLHLKLPNELPRALSPS